MPHFPKPFFRPRKDRWYVQLRGKQINLGPDERDAFRRYHDLMADRNRAGNTQESSRPTAVAGDTVVSVLDLFLEWLTKRVAEGTKAQRTYDWYVKYLNSFASFGDERDRIRDLTPDNLLPNHVYRWVDAQAGWTSGKRGAMIAVQRAFNWAAKAGLLKSIGGRSPLASLEKPQQGRRNLLVSPEEYDRIQSLVRDREFRDLLETLWETGCRPSELFAVEARHVELADARWVFPVRQSKGKKYQRVVYLTDKALAIRAERHAPRHVETPHRQKLPRHRRGEGK